MEFRDEATVSGCFIFRLGVRHYDETAMVFVFSPRGFWMAKTAMRAVHTATWGGQLGEDPAVPGM